MRKNILRLTILMMAGLLLIQCLVFARTKASVDDSLTLLPNRSRGGLTLFNHILGATTFMMPLAGTTFVVNTTADNLNNASPTPGSLRAAIRDANVNPGADAIEFNIPGAGPHIINVGAGLPDITDTVTIDGYTQPGASPNTLAVGNDAVLKIEIKDQTLSQGTGLVIAANDCLVQGLVIHGFNIAIDIEGDRTVAGASRNVVRGNFIGTNIAGTAVSTDYSFSVAGNLGGGVLINSGGFKPDGSRGTANNNIVGGTAPAARNVISGNGSFGVQISQNIGAATGNQVQGNYIGTNAAGTAALGGGSGIFLSSSGNTIGGTDAGARNVISGNNYNSLTSNGISICCNAKNNLVQGNFIGTDATGTVAVPNAVNGVDINGAGANDNTVGGSTSAARNIISGNVVMGVAIGNTSGNKVQGNYLGTDVMGTAALGNGFNGAYVAGAANATIGGALPGEGNLISANARGGIDITSDNTVVQGNLIGTKADGAGPLGNAQYGVRAGGAGNLIGGRSIGAGNVIAYSRIDFPFSDAGTGVIIFGSNTNDTVVGNSIHSNAGIGVDLGRDGLTANDNCDGDLGDGTNNKLQNYPVLTSAASGDGSTIINGTLNSASGTAFTLDFYANAACDASGFGEGQTYLGSSAVTTDATCSATFNVVLPVAVPAGQSITATATDPGGNTSEFSGCVQVVLSNTPPDAVNDAVTTNEDTSVTINVLANDSDPDGDALSVTSFTQGANGSVTSGSGGALIYTPNANYNGTDSFTYTISDGNGGADTATVNITVNPVADPPDAVDDAASVNEDAEVTINVLSNDARGDCAALTVASFTQGANGSVALNPDQTLRYTPHPNFNGTDSFTYTIGCAAGSDTATVTVNVTPLNDAPVAADDSYSVNEDGSLNVATPGVLGNDTDVEGDALTATLVTVPASGALMFNADGSFTYTPNANFNGTDSFTYRAKDAGAALSNVATVTIKVNPVNDAPKANDQSVTAAEDAAKAVTLTATDVDGDALTYSVVTSPAHGSLSGPLPNLTYTPALNYNGPDSFTFKVNDGSLDSNIATVSITVNPVNDPPDAKDDAATTAEDTPVMISVLANDTDVEGDVLTLSSVTPPANGTVVINAIGTVTYTPTTNFNGTDSFTYTVSDGNGGTDTATVSVTVTPVNDAPDARDDTATTPEDTAVNISVLANDMDPDGDTLAVERVTQPAHGTVTINVDKTVRYTPDANYNGVDAFTYTVNDGNGGTDTATVTVTVSPVNDAPVAVNDSYRTDEDTPLRVTVPGVLGNDTDPEGDRLVALLVTSPARGVLGWNADGSFTYTPAANFNGSDSFTYRANDGSLSSNITTISITINPVNDAPVANNDSYATNQNTTLNVPAPGVLSNDTDADGPSLSAVLVSGPASGTLTLNADGSFDYVPAANFLGTDSFTYRASDGASTSNTATVTIMVASVNPTWFMTGALNTGRIGHTATLLSDGNVLVVGGSGKSAELYDPRTGRWSRTGDLNTGRINHTATLLLNGKVLVAGGTGSFSNVNSAELYDPLTGRWTRTGDLNVQRSSHTATLLPDGKVLVAGGNLRIAAGESAELYDPATGTWSKTGDLNVLQRSSHTATLLSDGKVLVAGGATVGGVFSAELYDPRTGRWSRTGDLNGGYLLHTATLLPNGNVLLVGFNGAELYDPRTGRWSRTGNLNESRVSHTATLMSDGKVLVAGGMRSSTIFLTSSELYDPATGTWSRTASLNIARAFHAATLLPNGRVLAAGGDGSSGTAAGTSELYGLPDLACAYTIAPSSQNFGAGGGTGSVAVTTASGCDWAAVSNNSFISITAGAIGNGSGTVSFTVAPNTGPARTGTLTVAGQTFTVTQDTGCTFTISATGQSFEASGGTGSVNVTTGGGCGWTAVSNATWLAVTSGASGVGNGTVRYTVASNSGAARTGTLTIAGRTFTITQSGPVNPMWARTGNLNAVRTSHTATLLPNGLTLIVGGVNSSGVLNGAELYNPATGAWTRTGNLNVARFSHTATRLPNGLVLVAGGANSDGAALNSAELYNPATGTWSLTGNLNDGRTHLTATLIPDGRVLVAGGGNGGTLGTAELYNPATRTWSRTGSLNTARVFHTATLLTDGRVFVVGGATGTGFLNSAELYNPSTGRWSRASNPSGARAGHTATLLANGNVLITGGANEAGSQVSSELYFPFTGRWGTTGNLNDARGGHTATLLRNGSVLVAGGASSNVAVVGSAELYDPATGVWRRTAGLNIPRSGHTATLLNRAVLVAGGNNSSTYFNSSELYPVDAPPVGIFVLTQQTTLPGFSWTNEGGGFSPMGNMLQHDTVTSGAGHINSWAASGAERR